MLHLLVDRGTERSLSLLFPRPEKPILGPREGIRPFPVISLEPTAPWAATRTCWHNHFQVWPVAGTGKGASVGKEIVRTPCKLVSTRYCSLRFMDLLVIFDGFSPTARGRKAGLVHQAELVGISLQVENQRLRDIGLASSFFLSGSSKLTSWPWALRYSNV